MTRPTILVATWNSGLFAITDRGPKQEIANQSVKALAPDGSTAALAIVGGHSLCRRGPGGDWTTVVTTDLPLSCCAVVRDEIFIGTDDARMLLLKNGSSVLESIDGFDHVAGRDTWYAGSAVVNGQRLGPPLGIRSLAANADGSILFANVHVGGIPRSLDGGKTWQPTIDINTDVHEVRAHPAKPQMVVAAAAVGLCISRDFGATWTVKQQGLHAPYCSAVTFSGDDVIFSASTDHFAPQGRIYRRSLHSDASIAAVGGLPSWMEGITDTGCISTSGSWIAIADQGGTLYCSGDFGQTWSAESMKLPAPSSVLIC